jgi:formylmethanofuran dehydrogenase subunit E
MKPFKSVVDFHGHSCPGLAIGYRVSLRALREFSDRSKDEELVSIVENNSCAVDAIQVLTGCTFGKGNLIFNDYGKQVYTFIKRPSGLGIRISVNWKKPMENDKEKEMWERYLKGNRSQKIMKFVHSRKAAGVLYILDANEKDIMNVMKYKGKIPPEAGIYRSRTCEICCEQMMEPRARLKEGKIVCIPCLERKA